MVANAVLVMMWLGVTAYAIFGGADFGGGIWDLLAGSAAAGRPVRARIEHSIGPVWEANHVWLIFTLVVLWTGFSGVFAALASTLYIPFTVAALGIIMRGAAFAFRKEVEALWAQRLFGGGFALASVITPFAFGTIAGAVASGRVPAGVAQGDVITSWLNPTSIVGGVVAVGTCAYLAAVFLCADSQRSGDDILVRYFQRRATATGVLMALIGLTGGLVFRADSPALFDGLTHRGLPVLIVGVAAGLASLVLLHHRHFLLVRGTAALAVASAVWAWAVAQYPLLLPPETRVENAAADPAVLAVLLVGLGVGAALVLPSLLLLYAIFQSDPGKQHAE